MAKRIKYKIGDIFLIPLENDLKGVGRVLNNNKATIFIELYCIKPIKEITDFNYYNTIMKEPIIRTWCYDEALRTGEWEIIDNKPVEGEIDMPYFWTRDAGDKKYYISKGTEDSFRTLKERTEISKDDIDNYEPEGIGNSISERNRYIRRLKEAGLL